MERSPRNLKARQAARRRTAMPGRSTASTQGEPRFLHHQDQFLTTWRQSSDDLPQGCGKRCEPNRFLPREDPPAAKMGCAWSTGGGPGGRRYSNCWPVLHRAPCIDAPRRSTRTRPASLRAPEVIEGRSFRMLGVSRSGPTANRESPGSRLRLSR